MRGHGQGLNQAGSVRATWSGAPACRGSVRFLDDELTEEDAERYIEVSRAAPAPTPTAQARGADADRRNVRRRSPKGTNLLAAIVLGTYRTDATT